MKYLMGILVVVSFFLSSCGCLQNLPKFDYINDYNEYNIYGIHTGYMPGSLVFIDNNCTLKNQYCSLSELQEFAACRCKLNTSIHKKFAYTFESAYIFSDDLKIDVSVQDDKSGELKKSIIENNICSLEIEGNNIGFQHGTEELEIAIMNKIKCTPKKQLENLKKDINNHKDFILITNVLTYTNANLIYNSNYKEILSTDLDITKILNINYEFDSQSNSKLILNIKEEKVIGYKYIDIKSKVLSWIDEYLQLEENERDTVCCVIAYDIKIKGNYIHRNNNVEAIEFSLAPGQCWFYTDTQYATDHDPKSDIGVMLTKDLQLRTFFREDKTKSVYDKNNTKYGPIITDASGKASILPIKGDLVIKAWFTGNVKPFSGNCTEKQRKAAKDNINNTSPKD